MNIKNQVITVRDSFTRPNDTTPYAAQDVVSTTAGAVMTFADLGKYPGMSGYITKARINKSGAVATSANFRLYLYSVAPTAIADNAQYTLLWANRAKRIGHIDFALTSGGTGSDSANDLQTNLNIPFVCAVDVKALYGMLVATSAYTPAALEAFEIELTAQEA